MTVEAIVENWNVFTEEMVEEGVPIERILVVVARQFNVFRGLLAKALISKGLVPSNIKIYSNDEAAFI